jgi:hypothetical protein
MATITVLNDHMKLHRLNHTSSKHILISSHGHWQDHFGEFDVPEGTTLIFYCDDGDTQSDTGAASFLQGTGVAFKDENVLKYGARCKNYHLTKFQGRHGRPSETYQAIGGWLANRPDWIQQVNDAVAEFEQLKDKGTKLSSVQRGLWEQLQKNIDYFGSPSIPDVDVITIRHRPLLAQEGALLEDVIQAAQAHNQDYTFFHCSFCRAHD